MCYDEGNPGGLYIGIADPLHHLLQRLLARFQQHMHMVSHQTISKQAEAADLPALTENSQKMPVVFFIHEYLLPIDTPQHDMIDILLALLPCLSRHRYHQWNSTTSCLFVSTQKDRPHVLRLADRYLKPA